MKKAFFCLASVIICLFLILPFLDKTASSVVQSAEKEKESAIPQIFTSNPLTNLAKKIANLLRGKKAIAVKRKSLAKEMIAEFLLEETIGKNAPLIASANRNDINYLSSQASAISGAQPYPEGANQVLSNPLMDEDEDWIFIRQHSPKGIVAGMHEINARDNSHNTPLKQQNTRFLPMAGKQTQAASASHLSHMLKPMQNSFDLNGVPLAKEMIYSGNSSPDTVSSITSFSLSGRSRGLGKSGNKKPTLLARFRNIEGSLNRFKSIKRSSASRDKDTEEEDDTPPTAQEFWANLLNPITVAEQTGKESAEIIYPAAPQTKKEQKAKEQAKTDASQRMNELWLEDFNRKLETTQPLDEKSFTHTFGCDPNTLNTSGGCAFLEETEEKIQNIKEDNESYIRQELGLSEKEKIPALNWAVVYGKAVAPHDIETDLGDKLSDFTFVDILTNPHYKGVEETTLEKKIVFVRYQKQLDTPECQSGKCYWVLNQTDDRLSNTFRAAGQTPVADPVHKISTVQEQINKEMLAQFETQLQEHGIPEDQKEGYRQQFITLLAKRDPYIAYTEEELSQAGNIYFQNIQDAQGQIKIQQEDPSDRVFLFGSADSNVFNGDAKLEKRARDLATDAIDAAKQIQEIHTVVQQEAVEQSIEQSFGENAQNENNHSQVTPPAHESADTPTGGRH